MIRLEAFLLIGAVFLGIGLACVLVRRNIIQILMGVELILNAAALNFAAFAYFTPPKTPELAASGQAVSLFVIALAAAEAAVALALVFAVFHVFRSVDVAEVKDLQG